MSSIVEGRHVCWCGSFTTYKAFSGGSEWYCESCGADGSYEEGEAPRRAGMFRSEAGRIALRAEMDQELARIRDSKESRHS